MTRCLASSLSQLGGVSYHLPGPSPLVSWVRHESTTSDVPCVSSAELIFATLLVDVNCPGSQEDLVSNWEPAHSLVEDAISGAEIAPRLPGLAVPQFGLLSYLSSLRLSSGHSGPVLTLSMQPTPPCSALLAGGRCEHLGYFSTGSCS